MNTKTEPNLLDSIIARAWHDDAFRAQLKGNPVSVLRDHGVTVPPGVEVRVLEDSERVAHLTLPATPRQQELTDDDLDKVAAGALDTGLVSTLTQYFGWSAGQVGRILDADQGPRPPKSPSPAQSSGRSPPSLG